jgi:hypothetical protein
MTKADSLLPPPLHPLSVRRFAICAILAALALYLRSLVLPILVQDDFQVLRQSWTWGRTVEGLWVPQNEHAMPLGRLLTFALVQLAGGRLWLMPWVTACVGPLAVVLGMALTYLFVRRELGHPFYGLCAMVLFGVTGVYQQAVYWFAASFSVLALDTLLLALLAAQRWRQTGRGLYLDLTVLGCLLAPAWFAIGVLAGPLCCLYLLPPRKEGEPGSTSHIGHWTLLPLAGTLLFLAVSLPRTAEVIQHLEHYQGKTALESFGPRTGLVYTGRSLVDNLLFGAAGITLVYVPTPFVWGVLALMIGAGVWWWRQATERRLLLLGVGLILTSYLLTYSARAAWDYQGHTEWPTGSGDPLLDRLRVFFESSDFSMHSPTWSRYHLLPQLGLALFVCGGLPAWKERWFPACEREQAGELNSRQVRVLKWLLLTCLVVQLPRSLLAYFRFDPQQVSQLRQIDAVDARCREHHISAATAREALGTCEVVGWAFDANGYDFLRGSDDPHELTVEEARRLLTDE